jgi:hypothetical protein
MAGAKLQQAQKALRFCVENLNADDRFEIVRSRRKLSRFSTNWC